MHIIFNDEQDAIILLDIGPVVIDMAFEKYGFLEITAAISFDKSADHFVLSVLCLHMDEVFRHVQCECTSFFRLALQFDFAA